MRTSPTPRPHPPTEPLRTPGTSPSRLLPLPQAIIALLQCHKDNKWGKFYGACNEPDWALTRCLAEEKKILRWVLGVGSALVWSRLWQD
jgi:hypothetical protein